MHKIKAAPKTTNLILEDEVRRVPLLPLQFHGNQFDGMQIIFPDDLIRIGDLPGNLSRIAMTQPEAGLRNIFHRGDPVLIAFVDQSMVQDTRCCDEAGGDDINPNAISPHL